jgi:hypothetical protein
MIGFKISGVGITEIERLGFDRISLFWGDHLSCDEPVEDFIALADCSLKIAPRTAGVWCSNYPDEESTLAFCKSGGRAAKIIEGSFFDTIEAGSKINSIEISR